MSYNDIDLADMDWNKELQSYTYACPCGDLFQISYEDLKLGEIIARCPSCSLIITVIYDSDTLQNDHSKRIQASSPSPHIQTLPPVLPIKAAVPAVLPIKAAVPTVHPIKAAVMNLTSLVSSPRQVKA